MTASGFGKQFDLLKTPFTGGDRKIAAVLFRK